MDVRKSLIRAAAVSSFLLPLVFAQEIEGEEEPEDGEEDEEEEEEKVLAKTDGANIALCMFGIMTTLIAITCFFEYAKDMIYEATEKSSLPIVNALFSEMTVLGFLSMVTFIVASAGFITDLSVLAFGPERKEFLKELFEQAHYMLFLVMVIFFFFAIFILDSNRRSIELLRSLREHLLRHDWLETQSAIANGPVPSLFSSARKQYEDACYFLEYVSMRNEFIFGRQGNFPHKELDKLDRLPLDFDYARYLSIMLGHTMAKVIEVGASTWFQLWILNVAVYMLLLAFPPVGTTLPVSCFAWVALGYVEALCIHIFHNKVKHIRWCLCVPDELPHVHFDYDDKGMPHGRRVTNADMNKQYKPLINHTLELMKTPTRAVSKDEENAPASAIKNYGAMDVVDESGRGAPSWVNIQVDLHMRSKWDQWMGGKAPFRQMYLYWCETNGPELHLTFLRLHLVYLSIQITILAFVFAPLILKHYGHLYCWLYIFSPAPHIIYTVGWVIGPLIRNVTEVGCVGVVADGRVKKDVLRMMKTEKSVKGLMLLTNMKRFISTKKMQLGGKETMKDILKKQAKAQQAGIPEKETKDMGGDISSVAEKLFNDKFDTMQDGFCLAVDFALGLKTIAVFNDAENALAFSMADAMKMGRVDLKNFVSFFKRFVTEDQWREGLSIAEMKVGTKLHESFKKMVAGGAGEIVLSADDELARLRRDHGAAVLQIEEIFHQHDVNGDMVLDVDEVRVMVGALGEDMTEAEAAALVAHLDVDGDGELSMAEFVVWAFHRHEGVEPEDIEELAAEIFDEVFDFSADGRIDVDEFIFGLDKIKSDLTYNEKHDLFREADENGGGFIEKDEFIELMLKYNT